ncbi:MAG: carbohydrate ABC transporter permease [Thermomicrobiales bacterium]
MTRKQSFTFGNVAYWIAFVVFALFTLFPLFWVGLMAFKTNVDIIAVPPKFFFTPTLDNFREVLGQGDFLQYYKNTFIIAAGAVALTLVVGTPAAYVLARYDFKGKEDLAFTFLSFRFAPELAVIIPLFVIFQQLKLYDSYLGLILIYQAITLPLLIWLMRGYFEDVPKDIEQAAKVDGAGFWEIFTRIAIPLVLPGIAAAAVLAFIFSWNAMVFGLVLGGRETYPVTIGLLGYMGYQNVDWGPMAAATVVTIVPEFILASLVLRSLVRGLTFGAVHGG